MAQAMRSKEDKLRDTLTQIVSGQSRLLNRPEDLYEEIAKGLDDIENFKDPKDQLELLAWTLRADFISFKADSDEEKEYWLEDNGMGVCEMWNLLRSTATRIM